MPRAGLSAEVVTAEGARLLDELGPGGLTLAAVANSLGVRTPSIYKHVDGMPALQREITLLAKRDFLGVLSRAAVGKSSAAAVSAIAHAYREWALAHPGQYPLVVRAPKSGDAEDELVSEQFLTLLYTVLEGYDLVERDAVDAIRFTRAAIHGYVSLETSGGYEMPVSIDRSFDRTVASIITALATWAT